MIQRSALNYLPISLLALVIWCVFRIGGAKLSSAEPVDYGVCIAHKYSLPAPKVTTVESTLDWVERAGQVLTYEHNSEIKHVGENIFLDYLDSLNPSRSFDRCNKGGEAEEVFRVMKSSREKLITMGPTITPKMIAFLSHPLHNYISASDTVCTEVLGAFGRHSVDPVLKAVDSLQKKDEDVRRRCMIALLRVGRPATDRLSALIATGERTTAMNELISILGLSISESDEIRENFDPELAEMVRIQRTEIHLPPEMGDVLIKELAVQTEPFSRAATVRGLGFVYPSSQAVISRLCDIIDADEALEAKQQAAESLGRIILRDDRSKSPSTGPIEQEEAGTANAHVPDSSLKTIVYSLRKLEGESDLSTRRFASSALSTIGASHSAYRSDLFRAVSSNDSRTQETAVLSVLKLCPELSLSVIDVLKKLAMEKNESGASSAMNLALLSPGNSQQVIPFLLERLRSGNADETIEKIRAVPYRSAISIALIRSRNYLVPWRKELETLQSSSDQDLAANARIILEYQKRKSL